MALYPIGTIIKETRKRLGLSQEEVCFGICATSTLSKIETNERYPGPNIMRGIVQRLGMPTELYNIAINKGDFQRSTLSIDILQHTARRDYNIRMLLNAYKELGTFDKIEEQFYLLFDGIERSYNQGKYEEEVLLQFKRALNITLPGFSLSNTDNFRVLLTETEIILLNCMALQERHLDGHEEIGVERLYFLKKYLETHDVDPMIKEREYPSVLINIANSEEDRKNYRKELDIAEQGIAFCRTTGKLQGLGGFLFNKGVALSYLGKKDEAQHWLCLALAEENAKGMPISSYIRELHKLFGYDFADFLRYISLPYDPVLATE